MTLLRFVNPIQVINDNNLPLTNDELADLRWYVFEITGSVGRKWDQFTGYCFHDGS